MPQSELRTASRFDASASIKQREFVANVQTVKFLQAGTISKRRTVWEIHQKTEKKKQQQKNIYKK